VVTLLAMNEVAVTFTEKDFSEFRKFQNKMNVVFGEGAYVGTSYAGVHLNYSPTLFAMLRPFPPTKEYNFVVKFLPCLDCKKTELFLALPTDESYVCFDCLTKRNKKGK
jgi:hypothetical protein